MNFAQYAALLGSLLITLTGAVVAAPIPADLARELVGVMSDNPPGFTLASADGSRSVSIDGHKGYRIVFRQEVPVFAAGRQAMDP